MIKYDYYSLAELETERERDISWREGGRGRWKTVNDILS